MHDTSSASLTERTESRLSDLIERFDRRAKRLRAQANVYLGLIITILAAGTLAFVFAADIARLDLRSPATGQEQRDRALAALNSNKQEAGKLEEQLNKLTDTNAIGAKFSVEIAQAKSRYESAVNSYIRTECSVDFARSGNDFKGTPKNSRSD